MAEDGDGLAALRGQVADGHAAVADGRYDEAIARFEGALAGLAEALGAGHPEVVELAEDLQAAREMRDVSAWGAEMGFRSFGRPREPDDA